MNHFVVRNLNWFPDIHPDKWDPVKWDLVKWNPDKWDLYKWDPDNWGSTVFTFASSNKPQSTSHTHIIVPVLPLPPLQCTAIMFLLSAAIQSLTISQYFTISLEINVKSQPPYNILISVDNESIKLEAHGNFCFGLL